MKRHLLLITAVLTILIGCVAYPTTRTYFEPNQNDGIPTATSGCGYHTTKNDSLERVVDGVTIQVIPEYVDGETLKVTIFIENEFEYIPFHPEAIFVEGITGGDDLYPVDISTTMQMPSKRIPYYSQWYTLSYPITVNDIDDLNLIFPAGSITLPGVKGSALSFGFKKTEKADFYYNSINC